MSPSHRERWSSTRNISWMLREVGESISRRQQVWFACACCRRLWPLLDTPAGERGRELVEAAERWADDLLDAGRVHQLVRLAHRHPDPDLPAPQRAAYWAALAVFDVSEHLAEDVAELARRAVEVSEPALGDDPEDLLADLDEDAPEDAVGESAHQCALLREIAGYPFEHLAPEPAWLRWDGGTVPRIALAIHRQRSFADLPALHDALQDAGCFDKRYLDHCLSPGPHVPGCWLLGNLIWRAP
jgi:hypothetical protein